VTELEIKTVYDVGCELEKLDERWVSLDSLKALLAEQRKNAKGNTLDFPLINKFIKVLESYL
jgi:hypothetical protein